MSNERAKRFFNAFGFSCRSEPDWITRGQKPDLYCWKLRRGQGLWRVEALWVEVKTLDPSSEFALLDDAELQLQERAAKVKHKGRASAWVSLPLSARDARQIINMANRALRKADESGFPSGGLIVMVPKDPIYKRFISFRIETKDGKTAEITSCEAKSGEYGYPATIEPAAYDQEVTVRSSESSERVAELMDISSLTDDFRVALEISEACEEFSIFPVGSAGGPWGVRNVQRIREAISEANSQIKNGSSYREAPGLVLIYHDYVDAPENEIILSALYGDLTYVANRQDWKNGRLIFAENGAWNVNKNRSTSALGVIRNNARPFLVHNLWAHRSLPTALFDAVEVIPRRDGSFETLE